MVWPVVALISSSIRLTSGSASMTMRETSFIASLAIPPPCTSVREYGSMKMHALAILIASYSTERMMNGWIDAGYDCGGVVS